MPRNMPDAQRVNEALRRAREMQQRADPEPAPTPVPPPIPEPIPKPEPQPKPQPAPAAPPTQHSSPFDALLKDKERTMLLALLILLSGEGHTELLFALMYLLI